MVFSQFQIVPIKIFLKPLWKKITYIDVNVFIICSTKLHILNKCPLYLSVKPDVFLGIAIEMCDIMISVCGFVSDATKRSDINSSGRMCCRRQFLRRNARAKFTFVLLHNFGRPMWILFVGWSVKRIERPCKLILENNVYFATVILLIFVIEFSNISWKLN